MSDEDQQGQSRERFSTERQDIPSPVAFDSDCSPRQEKHERGDEGDTRQDLTKRHRAHSPGSTRAAEDDRHTPDYRCSDYVPGPRLNNTAPDWGSRKAPADRSCDYECLRPDHAEPPLMRGREFRGQPGIPVLPRVGMEFPARGIINPYTVDFLVPMKNFVDYLKLKRPEIRRTDTEKIAHLYNEYKNEFTRRQSELVFKTHRDDEWFRELYHPTVSAEWRARIASTIKADLKGRFLAAFHAGELDSLDSSVDNPQEAQVYWDHICQLSENEAKEKKFPANMLFIRSVPPYMKRRELEELCGTVPHFRYLSLSDANPTKKFHRLGWVVFNEGANMDEAFEKLDNSKIDEFRLHLTAHKPVNTGQPRIAPELCSEAGFVEEHLPIAELICRKFESLLGGDTEDVLCVFKNKVSERDVSEVERERRLMDLLCEYMRRAHLFCFYCAFEAASPQDFYRRCPGVYHYRAAPGSPASTVKQQAEAWARSLDEKIKYWYDSESIDLPSIGGRSAEAELEGFFRSNTVKIEEAKFRCSMCEKLFKGEVYVRKHINLKHSEKVPSNTEEIEYFNNYVRDPNHIVPCTPPPYPAPGSPAGFALMTPAGPCMPVFPGFPGVPPFAGPFAPPANRRRYTSGDGGGRPRVGNGDRYGLPSYPQNARNSDPRPIRSYVDLDAPAEGDVEIKYS